MSDKPVTFNPEGAGQPQQGNVSALQESDGQAPDFKFEVQKIVKSTVNESMNEFYKQQKSQMDRMENRISNDVRKQISILQQSGIEVTPDMQKGIEQATRSEVVKEYQGDSGSTQQTGQSQGQQSQANDPVQSMISKEVASIEKNYGVELFDGDPESQQIDHSSPYKFIQSYEKALAAKAAREGKSGQFPKNPNLHIHTSSGSGTPGSPNSGLSAMDKFTKGYNQKKG